MPIEKLTKKQLQEQSYRTGSGYEPYAEFLSSLRVGQGGRVTVADEGVTRQTVKNRLTKTAEALGVEISFRRSAKEIVVFEVKGSK